MPIQIALVVAIAVAFAAIVLFRQARAWWRYRGKRVVTCPENHEPAGVEVDARHAAITGVMGSPELRLSSCSRWPERAGCGAPCLGQIAAAPEECLVRQIAANWYSGKTCALCNRPFGAIDWNAAKPALLLPSGASIEWNQVAAEKLQKTMDEAQPVCFGCHMASTLVRERPELVSDRSSRDFVPKKS